MLAPSTDHPTGFDRFELHPDLRRGVRAAGFASPRPIQAETIPLALEGRDVLGLAQTGTGKTAAFALPLLNRLLHERKRGTRALVLAPTRELAAQIVAETRLLARFTRLEVALVVGGASASRQAEALRRRPEVVVACPGRLLDLVGQNVARLDEIQLLVVDEADSMFEMGFLPDLRRILAALPDRRQNLFFSATMPAEIRTLADRVLRRPGVVDLAGTAPPSTIDHALYPTPETGKRALLERILASSGRESVIVFTRTKHRARRLAEQLEKAGHRAVGLQGNMSQPQRERAMRRFRERQVDVLVATDIAARGIDVSRVSHVVNYDVPTTPEAYTHRVGRTGRAERAGVACTFVTETDWEWVRDTERVLGQRLATRTLDGAPAEADGRGDRSGEPRPVRRPGRRAGAATPRPSRRPRQAVSSPSA